MDYRDIGYTPAPTSGRVDRLTTASQVGGEPVPANTVDRLHQVLDRAMALAIRVQTLRSATLGSVPEPSESTKPGGRAGTLGGLLDHADGADDVISAAFSAIGALERELING